MQSSSPSPLTSFAAAGQRSVEDFAQLGTGEMVYIRPGEFEGQVLWCLFNANGQEIVAAQDKDDLYKLAQAHNAVAYSVC